MMKEFVSTITSKGQLTIPVEVRRMLGLKRGDKVVFQLEGREVRLAPADSRLAAGYQSIPALGEARTWAQIEQAVAEERAEEYARHLREQGA
jgi:AbrB family looped-hinge helix DNA binding protein